MAKYSYTFTVRCKAKDLHGVMCEDIKKNYKNIEFTGNEMSGHAGGKGFEAKYNMSALSSGTELSIVADISWAISLVVKEQKVGAELGVKVKEWEARALGNTS